MKIRQAFKFELRPSGEQVRLMRQFAGCRRYVYNRALALQQARREAGEQRLSYVALAKALTDWRNSPETLWLKQAPVHPLQHALKDLERAYVNFFEGRTGFPRFARKGRRDRFRYPDRKQFSVDSANGRVKLPKLGWVRYRNSRAVLGMPRQITISESGGRWYVSIQTEREIEPVCHPAPSMVGLDLGVARFATLSDGSMIEPLNRFRQLETTLARAQRALARKVKFSSNWQKQKARINRIHRRIANARNDFLHKTSTTISQNHAMVVIEDLKVRNMSRSAKGTIEEPGTNVRAKAGLNKAILDQGWGHFRRMLEYKLTWRGGELLAVLPAYTSLVCSACGHQAKENRPSQARFQCVACGHTAHADLNAACNILAAGHAVLACGAEALATAVKQEPAEATAQELAHA
jgi:putative transposase